MITIDPLRWLKRRRTTPVAPPHHDALAGIARDIGLTGRWEMLDNLPAPDRMRSQSGWRFRSMIRFHCSDGYGGGQQLLLIIC